MLKKYRLKFHKLSPAQYVQLAGLVAIAALLLFRLSSLTHGLSQNELFAAQTTLGWHGIYQHPFYLSLEVIRSVLFTLFTHHGVAVIRLANVAVGALSIVAFARLLQLWYGGRTAFFGSILFASSAWTLHVSRLASNDVLYLSAIPLLFVVQHWLRKPTNRLQTHASLLIWGSLLYVPGLVWLIALQVWLQRKDVLAGFKRQQKLSQRLTYALCVLVWLPLLLIHVSRSLSNFSLWLGLPNQWVGFTELTKQMLSVPVHLFIHGPKQPELWLGRAALLDIFSLVLCIIGIYFYTTHFKAGRSRWLLSFLALSILLVGLGGPVPLSLIVPLLYVFTACGFGYLAHDWLKVFPSNPLARGIGIGLLALAVMASSTYNLRAYFVAWPHTHDVTTTFISRP